MKDNRTKTENGGTKINFGQIKIFFSPFVLGDDKFFGEIESLFFLSISSIIFLIKRNTVFSGLENSFSRLENSFSKPEKSAGARTKKKFVLIADKLGDE